MRKGLKAPDIVIGVLLVLLGCVIAFPVFYAVLGAFKSESEFILSPGRLFPQDFLNTSNFSVVFSRISVPRLFINSFVTSFIGAFVRVVFAFLAAYAFVSYEFPGRKILFALLVGTMMFPADTLLVTNYRTVAQLGLTDTYLGIMIVSFVGASQMLLLRANLKSVPDAFRDAALADGCGDILYMLRILVPVCKGALITLFVQSFIAIWNGYLWPLMVTNTDRMRTLQVGIAMLSTIENSNYHEILAGAVVSLAPAFVLFYILRKSISYSMADDGITGR